MLLVGVAPAVGVVGLTTGVVGVVVGEEKENVFGRAVILLMSKVGVLERSVFGVKIVGIENAVFTSTGDGCLKMLE